MTIMSWEFESPSLHIHQPVIAAIAQLVERDLAKVEVAGPSPVCRSYILNKQRVGGLPLFLCPGGGIGRRARFRCVCREACRFESCSGHHHFAEIAQLVEHNLAKVGVASSSLVFRSHLKKRDMSHSGHVPLFC